VKKRAENLGVRTSAPSVFVADVASGRVLYAKNAHQTMSMASLTKLVTAMAFLDQKPDLSKTLTMQEGDFDHESKPVIPPGETITLEDALKSLLVGSVNASANALARVSGGREEFVARMNAKVKALGLQSPVLVEPSGVDPKNRANAADIAAILTIASGYPEIREFAKLDEITVHGAVYKKEYKIKSTNLLLGTYLNKDPYKIVAAKTGSLPEAGFCMAQVTSRGDGHEIVAVELGSDNHFSRYQDIKALTTWAFESYQW
jgi:D-alanyl-D-alanine carboxypeptidase